MISVVRVTTESRPRDRKRKRLYLKVGPHRFHITQREARRLRDELNERIERMDTGTTLGKRELEL